MADRQDFTNAPSSELQRIAGTAIDSIVAQRKGVAVVVVAIDVNNPAAVPELASNIIEPGNVITLLDRAARDMREALGHGASA